MTDKEHIQKTIVEGIVNAFNYYGLRIGDACVYTSYLTRALLKEKYNLDSDLVAGEVKFLRVPLMYRWHIEAPINEDVYIKLYNYASDLIDSWNKNR